ncbi:CHAT domain-containing protein [Haladaptatus pallidirubidus]|uniref:CHAT domain-containing protein n=1 Tax=Haladaptatus pallidirubidus TaxID=1008152 RepID=A0AAV3UL11_9EURY|nr:CHAT domain-containing protein [Haladaptatus pallidirubidus]
MEFRRHPDRDGLDVYDPIENVRFALYTSGSVQPAAVSTETFYFPVDAAVAVETGTLYVPKLLPVTIRTQDGEMVAETSDGDNRSVQPGAYLIELSTAPMKLYLAVESAFRLEQRDGGVVLDFGAETTVRVGARSYHDRPAETITVTDDVGDVMRALSVNGSALKTTSPERSFPTLRGHPPLIKRGDTFDAPDGLVRPDTGVKLVVPPDREHVFPLASLAYYHGAKVVSGTRPRLVAGEFEHELTGADSYEEAVNRTLRQTFFLDCLTRTEGYYQVDLHEREQVEPLVDLDFSALYDAPLTERLAAYLSVPFETLEPHIPNWRLGVDLTPTVENAEYLPYLADSLALVRIPDSPNPNSVKPMSDAQSEFFRAPPSGVLVRGSNGWDAVNDRDVFQVDSMPNVIEQAWAGPGFPLKVNKLDLSALQRRVDRVPTSDTIDIHVVCNDEKMLDEDVVQELYGIREFLDFDVTAHYDLAQDELRELLAQQSDFVHYIGHIDERGFLCSDGSLDARSLSEVNVTAFLLNACESYRQGYELVKKGSRGGVATLSPIGNPSATKLGKILARLLNYGFPLRAALSIARRHSLYGYQYTVIGDGGLSLVHSETGVPLHLEVDRIGDDRFIVKASTYPNDLHGFGTFVHLHQQWSEKKHISSAPMAKLNLTSEELNYGLSKEVTPVVIDDTLYWSDELRASDIK